ncbi:hypothetical protein [Pseudomonas panipatensis]|uniref:Uncharacterized protein n=1 Tax=Pseudomonas panipatensis TaxID=428992 RepID=A0A1G8GM57_9PSED|nr:hypothetical protein [Pseudomonas panipatensis]SDH95396.1 hypothetical protein SAMN05216272_104357 [Pseudomonas panipatensis]SMP42538.1 hypothetical protein SAMN06295951_101628 [Pseudomonas panipatensis]
MPEPTLRISTWKLILGIAAGIWLGCAAVAVSGALLYHWLPGFPKALGTPASATPPAAPAQPAATGDGSEAMFQRFLENQRQIQAQQNRQVEQSEQDKRFNSAPCQFWRQQYQADPSEKNRQKMDSYCG